MCDKLEADLKEIKEAALATLAAATHEESKAENKYDTRGLEASYLAGAQAKRVREMEEQLNAFKSAKIRAFKNDDKIAPTALIEVELNAKKSFVFIIEKGGGVILSFAGKPIQAIAPNSPLGRSLIGLQAGDSALVETPEVTREYKILSLE